MTEEKSIYVEMMGCIENDKYETTEDYPMCRPSERTEAEREQARKYDEDLKEKRELFWKDLKTLTVGLITTAQFNALKDYAWEDGHAGGYAEVFITFDAVLDVITATDEGK